MEGIVIFTPKKDTSYKKFAIFLIFTSVLALNFVPLLIVHVIHTRFYLFRLNRTRSVEE